MKLGSFIETIKLSELGILSRMPRYIIRLWLLYRLYWLKSDVLISYEDKGFLLYNTLNREIVVICVKPYWRNRGIGSKLLKRIPIDSIVVHRKEHKSLNFFKKNGFINTINLNAEQILSVKR